MTRPALAGALVCGVLLGACTVGPNYTPPRLATPAAYSEAPTTPEAGPLGVVAAGPADVTAWWTRFNDPELDRMVQRALAGNLDLQSAASRIRQARQQEVIAGAKAQPTLTATGALAGLRTSGGDSNSSSNAGGSGQAGGGGQSGVGGSGGGGFSLPNQLNLYSAGFDATWEIDIFGDVRRAVEAAHASTEAALWSQRDAQVSLTAEVANDYLAYRALQQQIATVIALRQREQDTLGIVRSRAQAGVVTQLDVEQENGQLAAIRAELPQLQAEARAQVHALGVLLGQQPEALSDELAAAAPVPAIPASLPVGLPSDLLRRRPDVREAERQLAAATANVGVAVADLYPKFNLLGMASLSAFSTGGGFSDPNLNGAAAGLIQWPVLQGGRIRANIAVNQEKRTQAYLAYQKAVLGAVRDVEDALARYSGEQQHNVALQQARTAAERSLGIARDQYAHGLVNGLNVLSDEQSLLRTEDQLAQSNGALTQALASLYKALGGGWSEENKAGA